MSDQRQYPDGSAVRVPAWLDVRVLEPLVVGAVGFLVSVAGIANGSPGVDEAATLSAAERSLPELWRMAHHIDGVHSTYYALVHLWFGLVPITLVTLRLPSSIAVGVAAALLVVLTRRLADGRTALAAGLVFAVLPRTSLAGGEGRSYALSTVTAVLATLVFVVAAQWTAGGRRRAWTLWVVYGVVVLLSAYVFLYTVLMVVVHGIALAVGVAGRRHLLRGLLSWAAAAVGAGLLLLPFVRVTSGQASEELYWMGRVFHLDATFWDRAGVNEYFGTSDRLAVVCGIAALVGIVSVPVVPGIRHRSPALAVAVPAVVVPLAAVVVVSLLVRPLYNSRYLTFTTPFVAVLVALGVTAVRWRTVSVVAVLLIVVLALPQLVRQRLPGQDTAWSAVAAAVARGRAAEAPGERDGIVYGPLPDHDARTTEYIETIDPAAFRGMRDLTAIRSRVPAGELWAIRTPDTRMPDTTGIDRVWYVGTRQGRQLALLETRLPRRGWHEDRAMEIAGDVTVVAFVRGARQDAHG